MQTCLGGLRAQSSLRRLAARVSLLTALVLAPCAPALAADSACRTALEKRVQACAQACIDKAKAAVDPAIRHRILGYGCTNNCAKLEMFNGHNCPS